MEMENKDHDLLIEVNTKVGMIVVEMQSIGKSMQRMDSEMSSRFDTKLDKTEANRLLQESIEIRKDHERRIRSLERVIWIITGMSIVAQILINIYF